MREKHARAALPRNCPSEAPCICMYDALPMCSWKRLHRRFIRTTRSRTAPIPFSEASFHFLFHLVHVWNLVIASGVTCDPVTFAKACFHHPSSTGGILPIRCPKRPPAAKQELRQEVLPLREKHGGDAAAKLPVRSAVSSVCAMRCLCAAGSVRSGGLSGRPVHAPRQFP